MLPWGEALAMVVSGRAGLARTVIPRSTTVPAGMPQSTLSTDGCPVLVDPELPMLCSIFNAAKAGLPWVLTWHDVAALVTLIASHWKQARVVALLHDDEGDWRAVVLAHVSARRTDLHKLVLLVFVVLQCQLHGKRAGPQTSANTCGISFRWTCRGLTDCFGS
jgi:hypothetical protein